DEKTALLSAVFFSLTLLVRLDSALFVVPAAAAWLFFCRGKSWKPLLMFCGVIGAVVIAQELLRLWFYHDLLPNTFYDKAVGSPGTDVLRGLDYVFGGMGEPPYFYAGGIFALVQLCILRPARRGFALYALAGIVLDGLYVASVGGDFMPGRR